MSDVEKAELETANFENFLRVGKVQFDRYELQKPPEPDVIGWRGRERFGIEITNFHRETEKRRESEEDAAIEKAFDIYSRQGGPDLLLHIMWAPDFSVQKKDREQLARKIASFALRHAPSIGTWLTLDWRHFDRNLMCIVDHISMYGLPNHIPAHWSAARGRFVPNWDVPRLQKVIDRKNAKPKQYLGKYFEIWLLIVSPFGAPSSWMEMTAEIRSVDFVSAFDRVFLLSSFPLEVVELSTIRP